ncbi:tyrosine-type recombinase/integrase [Corynebacterium lizhenjunii]|uniref:tyrosine-type recombinase/integrase n=1 Tax=Corynebacterium lizhenjunii TaxID=2709394 RepID=UPI0013EB9A72|nr:site-specific integrase [Corynebacterium lizhenjunii]
MASIKKYATATGHAWRVQYRSPDGRSRTKQGFRTKAQAQAWAETNAATIHTGGWVDPNAGTITVGELGEQWLSMQTHLKPKTMHNTRQVWRNHVHPAWGTRPIADILPSEVQSWVANIGRGASLVRQAHALLAQILDMAVRDGRIKANPARGVRLPSKPRGAKVYLTAGQLARLAGECSKHSELVWLLGTVGLRWGEAAALRVRDVNVVRQRISVERNAVTIGSEIAIGTPKTHERREVAVPAVVMGRLRPLLEGKGPEALLWARADGSPLRLPSSGDWYYRALGRVQEADPDFPRVTPHGLRHVAAGLMVSSGANVKVVQRQLGHASAAMTLDIYADLFDGDLDEVGRSMDALISRAV